MRLIKQKKQMHIIIKEKMKLSFMKKTIKKIENI